MLAVRTLYTQKAVERLHTFAHRHLGSMLCTELPTNREASVVQYVRCGFNPEHHRRCYNGA